jgi:hypothetical protein
VPDSVALAHQADQFGAGALGDQRAAVDDADAVAQPLGLFHVVSGENDRLSLRLEF